MTTFAKIAQQYDAFLVDLWGVVHDGTQMYPGAGECLRQLKQQNKPVIFISNAPRRAAKAEVVLGNLGVTRNLYQHVVTSGEVGFHALAQEAWLKKLGARYFFIGPERDADVLDGLRYVRVDAVEHADFILNVGFGSEQDAPDSCTPILTQAITRKLPMVCLNPDLEVVKITGERFACAGAIAVDYENMGGEIHWFGKPYPTIYETALALLNEKNVLAIGDSLRTDIAGANTAGIDSLFIKGGILKGKPLEACGPTPTFVIDEWVW